MNILRRRIGKSNRKTILLVDDELWLMEGVSDFLKVDYNVREARNADQALIMLHSSDDIDLIITDVMMPPGNVIGDPNRGRTMGLSFLRYLQQLTSHKYIPVIVYTVVTDKNVHADLLNAGATQIVIKTTTASELAQIIAGYFNK